MILETLTATSFLGKVDSGVSRPFKLQCSNSNRSDQYIVKLRSKLPLGNENLAYEIMASKMANIFGIATPEIVIVDITREFAESVEDSNVRTDLVNSVGLNFGSLYVQANSTWVKGQSLSIYEFDQAFKIFVFDCIIQNPDRTELKPNMLFSSKEFYVIDHEKAFSFLRALFYHKNLSFSISQLEFLREHIFFDGLRKMIKGQEHNIEMSREMILQFCGSDREEIFASVPTEWIGNYVEKIRDHFEAICNEQESFVAELKQLLS